MEKSRRYGEDLSLQRVKPLVKLSFRMKEKDLLTESEGSGFLDVPLLLLLDSTERQKHNHVITNVRDDSENPSCC